MIRRPSANFELPQALLAKAKVEMAAIPNERLFNSSEYEKSREKWCAAMLGLGYEKAIRRCRVAANESEQRKDVDLYLEAAGREYPFQLVEVMEPGRKRGAEYKGQASRGLRGFGSDPGDARTNGPRWIADRIAQKIGKRYAGASDLNLLVYANFTAHQLQHAEVLSAARPHLSAFASVWVVTSLWLGSLSVRNDLGRIDGWCIIFTPEQYAADNAG